MSEDSDAPIIYALSFRKRPTATCWRTPMHKVWSICLLILPMLAAGCHSSGQHGHTSVLGIRHASYSNGVTDVVQLWRDGTYQQDVRDGTGKTISHTGKWHIDENRQVEVAGWMNPESIALKRPDAGTSRPDVILRAYPNRLW